MNAFYPATVDIPEPTCSGCLVELAKPVQPKTAETHSTFTGNREVMSVRPGNRSVPFKPK